MRRKLTPGRVARAVALPCAAAGAASGAHLLALLGAAAAHRRSAPVQAPKPAAAGSGDTLRLAVVVPAHDEEDQIGATMRSIQAGTYPGARCRIVVVADNCTDRTAELARAAGAEVWERRDPSHRGKGYALSWAFTRLLADETVDAVCVVDADCEVSPNLLSALAARLAGGADAVQVPYLISNPDSSDGAALRWGAFALFNVVRPLGRHRLGLSSGLSGTGMAFSRGLLLRSPWRAFSFAEDREQHLRWALDGVRVEFAPEAQVRSEAPTTVAGSQTQMARWDSGRMWLAARLTPALAARWLRTGEARALDAALEPVLPPQSLLLGINLAGLAAGRLAGERTLTRVAAGSLAAQATYVIGGLAVVGAPPAVWLALLSAPRFALRRLAGLSRSLIGRGPSGWERTERAGAATVDRGPSPEPFSPETTGSEADRRRGVPPALSAVVPVAPTSDVTLEMAEGNEL